ncbi:MAG: hypothetical protein M1835_006170 [Candelina submexicana]|nr:MAG: hypothetical protein M1835_006170 [Candelina submexicana]
MRVSHILPFAALTTALVIPDEQTASQLVIETDRTPNSFLDRLPAKDKVTSEVGKTYSSLVKYTKNTLDDAIVFATKTSKKANDKLHQSKSEAYLYGQAWLRSGSDLELPIDVLGGGEHPPHDGPPHHGPPPPPHGPDHGHHGHHHKPNLTVYQLISESKYTTKLAELINEFDDIVQLLNGTAANYTVFAPTDHAFEKIPEHGQMPSRELLKKVLTYHVSSEFYPAGRVLVTHTIPTLLRGEELGNEPQRLSTNIGLKGLTVNFYSRIIAVDIFGTNGVIHGVDSILIPPPKTLEIIDLLPTEFSTLELGLGKTGLYETLNKTAHIGGTFFAPSNFAFLKLGPKINAFLFSKYGQKYLKALLQYHVVANQTLYSDAYYKGETDAEVEDIPKGFFHVDLPTLLEDRSLSIDIARYGRLISIKINGFARVSIEDGIAKDGVIQVVSSVLIPPKKVGGMEEQWQGEHLSVADLKERLEPLVAQSEL